MAYGGLSIQCGCLVQTPCLNDCALPKQKTNSVALPHAEGAATEHAFDIKYRDEEDTESQTSADRDFYGTLA